MNGRELLSKKKGYILFGFIGFVCAFLWKAERDLANQGNILWTGKYVAGILLFSALAGVLLGVFVCFLIYRSLEGTGKIKGQGKKFDIKTRPLFCGSFVLIVLCWIPCYLAYYPGICSYDTSIQLEQIVQNNYIDHHPIAHTLLFKGAMQLGQSVFGNINTGIAVYVLLQLLFLAGSFSYGIVVLNHFKVKTGWLAALQLYCMIYPFHWYMSVTTTKDTLFSAFFLLQILSLCGLLLKESNRKWNICHSVIFVVATVGMILFRNNGKYAMLVLLVFLLLAVLFGKKERKLWGKLTGFALTGFLVGNMVLTCLFNATDATQGDKREMLSVPIQQLARCMVYHGGVGVRQEDDNTLTAEEKALINEFLLNESYTQYRPEISDPVKKNTNTYVVRYRAKEFLSTYFSLFLKYPGDYINAVLALDAGYLSPGDVSHAYINVSETQQGLGYIQTIWADEQMEAQGIYKDSKWDSLHTLLEEWADGNSYLKLPVLKYLFVPGTYLWLYLLLTGYLLIRRKYSMLFPLSLVLGYYVTLILGPTVQLRYIYPLMIVFPLLWILLTTGKKEEPIS